MPDHNDLNRVHARIDTLGENIGRKLDDMSEEVKFHGVQIAKMETTIRSWPAYPERPCPEHRLLEKEVCQMRKELGKQQEDENREVRDWSSAWKRGLVTGIVRLIELGFVAFVTAVAMGWDP